MQYIVLNVVIIMSPLPDGTITYTVKPFDTLRQLAIKHKTTVSAIAELNPGMDPQRLEVGQTISILPGRQRWRRAGISAAELELNNHIRSLWEQHVFWTRLTIISMVHDLPDVRLVTNRLLRNPIDFQMVLEPLYGRRIAGMFAALLTDHLVIAAELVDAAIKGDTARAADAERRWYVNADKIAAFLAKINPHWSEEEWRAMLHEHLALTKSEVVDMIGGDFASSIAIFDQTEAQALEMADLMVRGIVEQFPSRFRGR